MIRNGQIKRDSGKTMETMVMVSRGDVDNG